MDSNLADRVNNSQDIIDSRDVIALIEELEAEIFDLETERDELNEEFVDRKNDIEQELKELQAELTTLKELAEQGESSPDWSYGETLVSDSYFVKYAEQLADDLGVINRDLAWPLNHLNWEAAAKELKQDYFDVEFGDVIYWIRS